MLMSDVATRVRDIVVDPNKVRWSDAELYRWAVDGELFIGAYRPDALAQTVTVTLAAGTKQSLPAGYSRLLDVIVARKADGSMSNAIRYIDRHVLESLDRDWHAKAQSQLIKHVIYDNRVPTEFYVYPPAKVGAQIDVTAVALPAAVTDLANTLTIADSYRDMLVSYVVFRCYCKDTEARTDRASLALSALSQALGIKLQKDMAFSPDLNNKGGNPNQAAITGGGV